jgi:hypothetical protein
MAAERMQRTGRPARVVALGLIWPAHASRGEQDDKSRPVTVVQLVEAIATPEIPDGTLRWAPAMLPAASYPIERLRALEDRTEPFLRLAVLPPPSPPRGPAEVAPAFRALHQWGLEIFLQGPLREALGLLP